MQVSRLFRAAVAGALVLGLVSCDENLASNTTSFQANYSNARNALEKGRFDAANRTYAKLVPAAGALQPRIRLELAHSQLRAGAFDQASSEAAKVAAGEAGKNKAAAQAVHATAEHELGLAAMQRGDAKAAATHLKRADKMMAAVLKSHADLDPLGALAARRASIAVQLKGL